ncbi:hypothetical protein TNCV_4232851 [Trichonephila clavipes]|nr:hypothetical protein TNCV_4232851 [Trichonephila clavipes]
MTSKPRVSVLVPLKIRRVLGPMLVKSVVTQNHRVGAVKKFGQRSVSSGIVIGTRTMFKFPRSVTNNPRVTLVFDVN